MKLFLLILIFVFSQLHLSAQKSEIVVDSNTVFTIVQQMPEFPGGNDSLKKYVEKSIQYPAKAKAEGRAGVCYAQIVIEKDGTTTNVKLLRSIPNGNDLNDEAIRVVSSLPKWNPGKQNGKFVRVSYIIPVRFKL